MITALEKRPTEAVTGLALAALIFDFLVQRGVPEIWAAIIAVVIAFVPAGISEVVDRIHGPLPPELQQAAEEFGRREAELEARRAAITNKSP